MELVLMSIKEDKKMKQIYQYDMNGKYVGPVLVKEDMAMLERTTEIAPPQPMFDPTFNAMNQTWSDITEEECLIKNPIPVTEKKLTELEQLQQDVADMAFQMMQLQNTGGAK